MLRLRLLVACIVSIGAAGCAIRPLPQDVTGYNTYQIVSKIRCEARDAIRSYVRAVIRLKNPEIADGLKNGTISYKGFDRRRLSPEAQLALDKYDQAVIAYDFTFDMTEVNNITPANADFLGTLTRGTLKIGLTAGNERSRENSRQFRITDDFENLVSIGADDYCLDIGEEKNWVYPITGSIGLSELIGTFLNLNQSGNLGNYGTTGMPGIADTITFITKFTAGVTPKIELSPVGRGFEFVGAGFSATASRNDNHKVIVAVTLPPEVHKVAGKKAPTVAQKRAELARAISTARAGANRMIDEQIYRNAANVSAEILTRLQSLPR